MRRSSDPDVQNKQLQVVDLSALPPDARAAAEEEIRRHEAEKAERRRLKKAFAEIKDIRRGTPGAPLPQMPTDSPSPRPVSDRIVAADGGLPAGAGMFVPAGSSDLPMEVGPPVKKRPGKEESDVSDGGRMAPGGYSNVEVVRVDENGDEVRK